MFISCIPLLILLPLEGTGTELSLRYREDLNGACPEPIVCNPPPGFHRNDTCDGELNYLTMREGFYMEPVGMRVLYATVYFIFLMYLFVGVSIVSDKFMAGIEVITSNEKEQTLVNADGEEVVVKTLIWNETVANLTLMALGSSAPEILLAVIEILADEFKAGELGPGTIIGSASFNLFMIIAICIMSIPSPDTRRIDKFAVYVCTAFYSVFAYIWLLLILAYISPCEIEIWEGAVTLVQFPIMVVMSYIIDIRTTGGSGITGIDDGVKRNKLAEDAVMTDDSEMITADTSFSAQQTTGGLDEYADYYLTMHDHDPASDDPASGAKSLKTDGRTQSRSSLKQPQPALTAAQKQHFMERLNEMRVAHPEMDEEQILETIAFEILQTRRKSRAYYRLATLTKLKGNQSIKRQYKRSTWNPKNKHRVTFDAGAGRALIRSNQSSASLATTDGTKPAEFTICFNHRLYTVRESVGTVTVHLTRIGRKPDDKADFYSTVKYKTAEGTAKSNKDFVPKAGTVTFKPGEFMQAIEIEIIDDEIYELDEYFTVQAFDLHNMRKAGGPSDPGLDCKLVQKVIETKIVILDDDHRGVFGFLVDDLKVQESQGEAKIPVKRYQGVRGSVAIPYRTEGFTALPGKHFVATEGELVFEDGESEKEITVKIINNKQYETNQIFNVILSEPKQQTGTFDERSRRRMTDPEERIVDLKGNARLGNNVTCTVTITEDQATIAALNSVIDSSAPGEILKQGTWADQFRDAIFVVGEEDEETGEEQPPSKCDWVLHVITVPWKLLFALIPPGHYCGGALCFVFSLVGIGMLTFLIEKMATCLGCASGLKDTVTAISIVALGTSLPDTFASRAAAVADDNADASVGNVTGSNAVNVYLGIGLAWTIAAIAQGVRGCRFEVDKGDLEFCVMTFCGLAAVAIMILFVRRKVPSINAELGGPFKPKLLCALSFAFLWVSYVTLASMKAYDVF